MVIIVSGTPGTGKTSVAKALAKKLNYEYIDVNDVIKKQKIPTTYDKKRRCKVIDIKKLNSALIKIIKKNKNCIIDSHISHYLPKRYVDLCIITKCDLKTLQRRLKKRKYSNKKIRENLDSEIFEVCLIEAEEKGHKLFELDTTKKPNIDKLIKQLKLKVKK